MYTYSGLIFLYSRTDSIVRQVKVKASQSCPTLCDPMDYRRSVEFSRPEYWEGQPFPSPGDLPDPRMEPSSLVLQVVYLPAEPPGKSKNTGVGRLSFLQQIFPGIEPGSPALQVDFFFLPTELSGKLLLPTELAGKPTPTFLGFPCGSAGKASFCNAGDLGDT